MSEELSKSKQKREARKAEAKQEKTKKNVDTIVGIVIGVAIAACIIGVIIAGIYKSVTSTTTESSANFSYGITDEGLLKDADLSSVKDLNLNALKLAKADVEYTDEDVESDINRVLTANAYYDDSASLTVEDGSTINLDYVGYVDDVAFEGGDTKGNGATLEIGSQSYIDTFEQQLIGAHPGDKVTVNVTFPDPYTNNPDLAGKPARFECVINSIKVTPELTDAFVAEKLSEVASTVEEYRAYVKKTGYEVNVKSKIASYVSENAEAKKYNKSYLNNMKGLIKFNDEQTYSYYNYYYQQYLGYTLYSSFNDYTQMTDEQYEANLVTEGKKQVATDMTYEKYFKDNNLSISSETYATIVENYGGDSAEENYGKPYLMQIALKTTVVEHLLNVVTVE